MKFARLDYLPAILVAFAVFFICIIVLEKRFFKLVKTYWFYGRSMASYISTIFFVISMGTLLFALMDARGPEEKIKMEVPTDRTIILIDTSASMLAEDVKPSRLRKAVLLAKHFARKAPGHQLAIVAFAEIQKKIVPFTNDIDLIDSRLDSIENLRNQYGSSALSAAVQESVQYFKEGGGEARGNILVLTDGEETAEDVSLNVPKEVHVAFVGVGTEQGGRIPLDDGRGFRFGYKRNRGQDVITKLNEDFFKRVTADIPSGKYWLANSYSLPSDEIMDFFVSEKKKGMDQQDMVIRPVLMEWIVVPALILLILSYMMKYLKVFTLGLLLLVAPVWGEEKEKEKELSPEIIQKLQELKQGDLNKLERLKLAQDLHKSDLKSEALELYQENLNSKKIDKSLPPEAYMNYGTALLEKGDTQEGLKLYEGVVNSLKGDTKKQNEIKDIVDKNIVTHFKQQQQKKQEQDKKKDQKQDQKKDQDQQKGEGSPEQSQGGEGQQNQKNQSKPDDKQDPKKDQQGKDEQDKKKESESKDKEDKEKDQDKDQEDKKDKGEKGEEQKKLPPQKLPAKLKQLMSDDRKLQMKLIEQGTRDLNKKKSRKSKDW